MHITRVILRCSPRSVMFERHARPGFDVHKQRLPADTTGRDGVLLPPSPMHGGTSRMHNASSYAGVLKTCTTDIRFVR